MDISTLGVLIFFAKLVIVMALVKLIAARFPNSPFGKALAFLFY